MAPAPSITVGAFNLLAGALSWCQSWRPTGPSEPRRAANRAKQARYRQSRAGKVKIAARARLRQAVRSGRIERQPCEVCSAARAEAHHPDYQQPLAVRWLCRRCHADVDAGRSHLATAHAGLEGHSPPLPYHGLACREIARPGPS